MIYDLDFRYMVWVQSLGLSLGLGSRFEFMIYNLNLGYSIWVYGLEFEFMV